MPAAELPLSGIQNLMAEHDTRSFRCRKPALQSWLRRHALANQALRSSQTYVVLRGHRVVAYYALTYGEVRREDWPAKVSEGMPLYPIPILLLARLAVDDREAGKGLGKALLKDALLRAISAAEIAGLRAVLVHALDDEARAFYEHFGFENSLVNPLHLMILIDEIRREMPPGASQ
jgi:GNAT superfamily N-acetyltransferase